MYGRRNEPNNQDLSDKSRIQDWGLLAIIEMGLGGLKDTQSIVSAKLPGALPEDGHFPSKEQIATYFSALYVEIAELQQEFNWKPWIL